MYTCSIKLLTFLSLFAVAHAGFDFDPNTPMPPFVLSKHPNASKPRLEVPMIIEYANISMGLVPITVQYAIDRLKNATPHLQDFELQVNFQEGFCADGPTVLEASSILQSNTGKHLPIIYTSGCPIQAQSVIAEIVGFYNFTAITLVGADPREELEQYFKLSVNHDIVMLSILKFFQTRNWTKFALVADDTQFYSPVSFPSIKKGGWLIINPFISECCLCIET